jgi:MYXO-CTERM domain-containing protein
MSMSFTGGYPPMSISGSYMNGFHATANGTFDINVSSSSNVPEPSAIALGLAGLATLGFRRGRRATA